MRIPIPGLVCLLAAGLLSAQYPGQYPPGQYPPGQYPPGQYPGGQSPFPRIPFPGRGKKPAEDKKASAKEVLEQFSGKINKVEKDSFSIEASDTRLITFRSTKTTKYFQEGEEAQREVLKPGMDVSIEARSDNEGFFYAVNVSWKKPVDAQPAPTATAPPAAKQEVDDAPQQQARAITVIKEPDPENPDAPKLRRGKPAPRAKRAEEEVAAPLPMTVEGSIAQGVEVVAPPEPIATVEPDPFLEKAIEMANSFEETLPNYLCNQFTTRFQGEGKPINWVPLDVVSAAVAYQDGKETYHDIKINNKAVNKPMEEMSGSWSRGEFGTTLRDIFSPATAADFKKRRDSTASGRSAVIYDFDVKQTNSHWQTVMGGQSVMPAYSGTVWIDKQTARVLRIEMQAKKVPKTFPLDAIEWVVDYSFVRIGGTEYLLPAHAANLACWRGTLQCARSTLDFRNYRKFGSESQIIVTDSTVNFEGEEGSKSAPAAKKK